MKWVIWNKTLDLFWCGDDWSVRYYASKFTIDELEREIKKFVGNQHLIIAVIVVSI